MKDLTINLKLNKQFAEAASREYHAGEKTRITKALSEFEVAEKAKSAIVKRENQQRIQEIVKAHKTEIDEAKEAGDAEAKAKARAARDQIAEEKRLQREAKREEARLDREYHQQLRRNARESIAEKKQAAREFADFQAEQDAKSLARMKSMAAAGTAAAAAGVAVIKALEERTQARSDIANRGSQKTVDYTRELTELATLRGKAGQTGPELAKNLRIAAQTALPLGQVASLTTSAYAGANAILDKPGAPGLMAEDEFAKFVSQSGKYATAMGGEAGDYGAAAAMIPLLTGRRMTSEEGEAELLRYDKFATKAGVTNPGIYLNQMKQNQGFVAGGVMSGPELAALTAGMTKTSGAETAGTKTRQLINALMAGRVRSRGMAVGDELKDEAEKSNEYFTSLGMNDQTDVLSRADMISNDLEKQQAEAQAAGRTFNANEYLMLHGMVNDQGRQAMLEHFGNRGMFRREIQPVIGEQFAPGEIDRRFQTSMANNLSARQYMVEADSQAADVIAGQPVLLMNQMKEGYYNRLKSRGEANGPLESYTKNDTLLPDDITSPKSYLSYITDKVNGVNERTLRSGVGEHLESEAKRLGLGRELAEFQGETSGISTYNPFRSDADTAAPYEKLGNAIMAAGGNPIPSVDTEKLNKTLDRLTDVIEVRQRVDTPAALPGRPVPASSAPQSSSTSY